MIMISGQETVSELEPGMDNERMTDCSAPTITYTVCSFSFVSLCLIVFTVSLLSQQILICAKSVKFHMNSRKNFLALT